MISGKRQLIMVSAEILAAFACGISGLGVLEYWMHKRALYRIPIRIHVSGTRGKSSVTRLLASAMNEAGINTVAKTTGTLARMILPDGKEVPIYRPAGANIIEQKRIISVAADMGAQAIILECMALQPYLHWVLEDRFTRATHGVITNARADHLDIMGPGEEDVARTLAGMIPVDGKIYTAERRNEEILKLAAKDRNSHYTGVSKEEVNAITDEDMAGFKYTEHKENVALVLKVLEDFGIDRETAIRGMWKTNPDSGALSESELEFFGRKIVFVNGFAANDPESTETIWNYCLNKHKDIDRVVGVFNLRADRPSRTQQLARDTDFWHRADNIVLMGTGAYLFARIASSKGLDPAQFLLSESSEPHNIFETILSTCGKSTLVIGMGNIGGAGMDLVRYFRNRAVIKDT